MMKRYILLETNGGRKMLLRDHTEWFRRRGGMVAVENYHRSIINAATTKRCAGSMENIKRLARKEGSSEIEEGCVEIDVLVINGVILKEELNKAKEA
jgi:hypothetical protein